MIHWVLDHHRCRGEDDAGAEFIDNDAIRRALRPWRIQFTLSPAARRGAIK